MNWANILNKNKKEFETKSKVNITEDDNINYTNYELKDYDEEFDILYNLKIYDLKSDFKELIEEESLPFMDKIINFQYSFYDFIKNNCENYLNIIKKVDSENEEYLKELEEEDEKSYIDSYDYDREIN